MKNNTMKAQFQSIHRHSLANRINLSFRALALALLTFASAAKADEDNPSRRRAPELPSPICDSLNVPAGNRVSSHAYAWGVQIYRWSGTNWVFIAPEATLFADPCYDRQVGTHYAGPIWEASDGSKVVGANPLRCTPFRGAIPWLRLEATSAPGHGRFAGLTYIQRINTVGGTAPAEAGAFVGDEARVPYIAEYYFYRATNH